MTDSVESEDPEITNKAASVACVLEDEETDEAVAATDADTLPLYNLKQKETVNDVIINPALSTEQQTQIREILNEYKEIFSDVRKVTHLIELTDTEPVKHKSYSIPYKMQVIDKSEPTMSP